MAAQPLKSYSRTGAIRRMIVLSSALLMATSLDAQTSSPSSKPDPVMTPSRAKGRFPSDGFASRGPAWFKSAEALRLADNTLSHQTAAGGWEKNVDQSRERREPNPGDATFENSGTFDNGATLAQMRFMGLMYKATGEPRFKDSYLRGVDFILNAQYPNGGWPQFYPAPTGYRVNITFNDGVMVNLLKFLRDLAAQPDRDLVDAARIDRAGQAVAKGIACILKCQIRIEGKLTGWCAQHDPETFAPAQARAYELPSISGGEGPRILEFLMDLPDPGPEIRAAIHAAADWYEAHKVTGIRLEWINGERVAVADPAAPPLWARFYEIPTGKPMFWRDGQVKWDYNEMEPARRNGYNWYSNHAASVLKKYNVWRVAQGRADR